jgi:predicted RNase H-like nuclease
MAEPQSIVLGIDAAWTAKQPSGVALVCSRGTSWQCLALAPSYASFGTQVDWKQRPVGGVLDGSALLAACVRIAGALPDVIAIDMPLSTRAITCRRVADNAIASAYGARGLGTHSPNATRPGAIARAMYEGFAAHGYTLACTTTPAGTRRVMLEVFPHTAAIELLGATYRVPYKLSRIRQYWPERSPAEQRRALLSQWSRLRRALASQITGAPSRVPSTSTLAELKRHEDAMDALLCAWVGTRYLAGRARAHGDDTAAVWA